MAVTAPRSLRFGTRGSALAVAQTRRVIDLLRAQAPDVAAELVTIRTEGDIDKTTPLTVIGGRGVFTSALQDALLRGTIAAAVHSAKDLPTDRPAGLALAAFPERDDPRDVLVSRHGVPLAELPPRPVIGTSSRRRAVQVRRQRPDARIVDLRGNVDTRLRRALSPELDAIIVAAAGVRRMGWSDRIAELLPLAQFVPSPGQGALAIETRINDAPVRQLLAALDVPLISGAVRIERAFLRAVGGGCTKPIGAYASQEDGGWRLLAMIAAEEGDAVAFADEWLESAAPESHATEIARELLAQLSPPVPAGAATVPGDVPERTLAGWRVLVTRPRDQAATLSAALRARGAVPVEAPMIRIEDVADSGELDQALAKLAAGAYAWVVFTSVNAVERLLTCLADRQLSWPLGSGVRVAAVGRVTAAALQAAGIAVDLVPDRADAESVVAALTAHDIAGRHVLYPKGEQAREVIPAGLGAAGAIVDAVAVYRTVPERAIAPEIRDRIVHGEIDAATFASPSSVRALTNLLGGAAALQGMAIICVGPVTAAAAREQGLTVHRVAKDASVAGIVEALAAYRRTQLANMSWQAGDRPPAERGDA